MRQGLQDEEGRLDTDQKIELINRLTRAQFPLIECTSFASPHVFPQFYDARRVARKIRRRSHTKYIVRQPNHTLR